MWVRCQRVWGQSPPQRFPPQRFPWLTALRPSGQQHPGVLPGAQPWLTVSACNAGQQDPRVPPGAQRAGDPHRCPGAVCVEHRAPTQQAGRHGEQAGWRTLCDDQIFSSTDTTVGFYEVFAVAPLHALEDIQLLWLSKLWEAKHVCQTACLGLTHIKLSSCSPHYRGFSYKPSSPDSPALAPCRLVPTLPIPGYSAPSTARQAF